MRLFKKCFCEPKVSEKAMSFHMVRSALIIVACLIALSFSAYAWFTVDVSSGTNTLVAARFNLDFKVTDKTNNAVLPPEEYELLPGEYSVELSRTVNRSDAQNGFCIVKVTTGSVTTEYHTRQIPADTPLVVSLTLSQPVKVEFIPCLGTSSYHDTTGNPLYLEFNELKVEAPAQEELPSQNPEQTVYTVVEGDSLFAIATKYGTTIEAISLQNDIADQRTIYIGQQLIIPPAETEPPVETEPPAETQ